MLDQTKKKKKHGTRVSRNQVPCKKKICKCNHPIFREPYSNVFKLYNGIFKQIFFYKCDCLILGSGNPIVAFLNPIMTF